jgi:thiol-disulfide isomerase/thioredoxin
METEAGSAPPPAQRIPRPLLFLGIVAIVAALAFAVTAALMASRSSGSNGEMGNQSATLVTYATNMAPRATQLHLPRLGGGAPVTLARLGREPIVVNFFASWCTACQQELKAVAEVAGEGRVGFVGVDTNETSDAAALTMLHRVHARYPVGIGGITQTSEYRVPGLPTTVFIDARGRVVAEAFGAVTRPQLTRWVDELARGARVRS